MEQFKIISKIPTQSIGWLETRLSKSVMERLQSYIEVAKKNPVNHNSNLAGNISKSLVIEDKDDWFHLNILDPLISSFTEIYPEYNSQIDVLTESAPYWLQSFWVNFQKENEFNPSHNHGGVFSFVIFVKIPTDWREQHALPISANSNSPSASNFEFWHTTMLGQLTKSTYVLDKTSESQMLFFPAKLMHAVNAFYNCDKERISISGNIRFDNGQRQ